AEEKYIVPVLGERMYEDFLRQKNVVVTETNKSDVLTKVNEYLGALGVGALSEVKIGAIYNSVELITYEPYRLLWHRYLWRIVAEAVDASVTIPSWLRHTAQGQQKHNPFGFTQTDKVVTGNRDDIRYKMDSIVQGRIGTLVRNMRDWIKCKKNEYPLFPDVKGGLRMGGILTGLYE
ncbi:MAG TPA: hypothetical protein VIK89_02885, partial [Cytophagaceae bacterium]